MFRRLPHETFRVRLIRHIENRLTLFEDACGLPVVNHGRREQRQARVAMFLVVPAKESLTECTAVLNAPEAVGELRPIFQGAELTFRIRIVIGDVRTAVGFRDTQSPVKKPQAWNSWRCRDRHAA